MSNSLMSGNPSLLRCRLKLKKFDNTGPVFFEHNMFNPPETGPQLIHAEVGEAFGQTGEVQFRIEDEKKDLDAGVITGNKFLIELSSDGVTWDPFLAGWTRVDGPIRAETGLREYWAHGFGNAIRVNERLINVFKTARRDVDGQTPDLTDPGMKCSELLKKMFSAESYPFGDPDPYWTTTACESISEVLASLKTGLIELSDPVNRLMDASGAIFSINAEDQVAFRYPNFAPSGITIKSVVDLPTDPEAKTGYFIGPWSYKNSILKSDGFSNRLVGVGGTDFHLDVEKWTNAGSDELHSVDRGMQWIPASPKLSALALKLSKVGSPTAALQGEIRFNDEVLNSPDGEQIGSFSIAPEKVTTSATDVNEINVQMSTNMLQVNTKYWIVLLRNGDGSNYYKWHHNGGSGDVNSSRGAGAWTTLTGSKAYCIRTYYSRRVLAEMSDMISRNTYGTTETKIYAPFIIESRAMDTLLTGLIQKTARRLRTYETQPILGPSVPLHAGTVLRMQDELDGLDEDAHVQSVKYTFDTRTNAMGTRWVELGLNAHVQ